VIKFIGNLKIFAQSWTICVSAFCKYCIMQIMQGGQTISSRLSI